jgi:hypothetical protein
VLKGKAGSSGRPEITKKLISVYSPKGAGMKNIIAKYVGFALDFLVSVFFFFWVLDLDLVPDSDSDLDLALVSVCRFRFFSSSFFPSLLRRRVELHHTALSQENVYVLDTLEEMFLYQGKKASKMAMTAAVDIAARMNRMDHGSRLKVRVQSES